MSQIDTTGLRADMLDLPYRLGVEWKAEPAWHEYRQPWDEWFEEWFVSQVTYLWSEGYSLETEYDALGRFRIRARGRGA